MAVPSFGASNLEPAGRRVVGIRIKRVTDHTVVRIDAQKDHGQQIVLPCRPEIRAGVYAASRFGLLVDQDVKSVRVRPRRVLRSLCAGSGTTRLSFSIDNDPALAVFALFANFPLISPRYLVSLSLTCKMDCNRGWEDAAITKRCALRM